jgi:hypothetical protein
MLGQGAGPACKDVEVQETTMTAPRSIVAMQHTALQEKCCPRCPALQWMRL